MTWLGASKMDLTVTFSLEQHKKAFSNCKALSLNSSIFQKNLVLH